MKSNITLYFGVGIIILSIIACSPRVLNKAYDKEKTKKQYNLGIGDAAKPQTWEIEKDLVKINISETDLVWKTINNEEYILVSSWKADTSYYKNDANTGTYYTGNYPIWVTTAPELQELCSNKKFGRKEGLDLRLKQLLGLPPNVEKSYFIEFWVQPKDLFRPCLDNDVSDVNCTLAFPDGTTEDYIKWVNELRIASYYEAEWDKNYPWTQLGYTYDWHPKNKNHVGLSEFVIGKNKEIIVNNIYTTSEYCKL